MYEFRWNEWNVEHIGAHGMTPAEAEYLVNHARSPYPRNHGGGRYLVVGQTADGTYAQVVFVFGPPGEVFVIHARPLKDVEKRRLRRGRKR